MSSFETSRSLSVQPLWNDYSRKSGGPLREERLRGGGASAVAYDEVEVEVELLELFAGKVSRSAPHTLVEDSCAPSPFLR